MTALESLIQQLKDARATISVCDATVRDDYAAMMKLKFANLVLGAWPTIMHALEEMNRKRLQ